MNYKPKLRFFAACLIICILISSTACSSQNGGFSNTLNKQTSSTSIQNLIDSFNKNSLIDYVAKLSGEAEISVGEQTTTLTNRRTGTESYDLVAQYVYEFMENLGYEVTYQNGETEKTVQFHNLESETEENDVEETFTYPYKNVIVEKKGTTKPNEVVVLCAHLDSTALNLVSVEDDDDSINISTSEDLQTLPNDNDDVSEDIEDSSISGDAPGADDNATGCAAIMHIAELLSQYDFERTIRFCFFDAEEEEYIGSTGYAQSLQHTSDNIKAVINLDMLGWESDGKPVLSLITQSAGAKTYDIQQELSKVFMEAIKEYGLSEVITLSKVEDDQPLSDHISFWNEGFPALCIIEDVDDFNPNANTEGDVLENVNPEYFANAVKVVMGSFVNLAGITE